MTTRSFDISRLGLWVTYAGLALGTFVAVIFAILTYRPALLEGQDWLLLLFPMTLGAIALTAGGMRWYAQFRTAEKIAARAKVAEANGRHPLVNLIAPVLLGFGVLYFASRGMIGNVTQNLQGEFKLADALVYLVVGAPVIIMGIATLILVKNRSKRPSSITEHIAQKAAEKRQSKWLVMAVPAIILVPYFAWVALQPPIEPYVPGHLRDN